MKFFSIKIAFITAFILMPFILPAGIYVPIVRIDNSQNAVAVWECSENSNMVVKSASKFAGSAWSSPITISSDGQNCLNAVIDMNCSNGNAVALWLGLNSQKKVLLYGAMLPFGKNWTNPLQISNSVEDVKEFDVSINNNGTVLVAWVSFDSTGKTSFYSSSASIDKYNSWTTPQIIYSH